MTLDRVYTSVVGFHERQGIFPIVSEIASRLHMTPTDVQRAVEAHPDLSLTWTGVKPVKISSMIIEVV